MIIRDNVITNLMLNIPAFKPIIKHLKQIS